MPSKRERLNNAPLLDLRSADAALYGDSSALEAVGFRRTDVGWTYGRATLTATSLQLPADTTEAEWDEIGRALGSVQGAIQWWIADLVLSGQGEYGVMYERAMETTGLAYKTLRNLVSVAGRFELSRRRDNLSFGHHALVAALSHDEQERWLDHAAAEGLSVEKLRKAMRGTPSPVTADLKAFRRSFRVVWRALEAGETPSAEAVEALERWVEALKHERRTG